MFFLVPVLFALMGQAVPPSAVPPPSDSLSLEKAIQVALEQAYDAIL